VSGRLNVQFVPNRFSSGYHEKYDILSIYDGNTLICGEAAVRKSPWRSIVEKEPWIPTRPMYMANLILHTTNDVSSLSALFPDNETEVKFKIIKDRICLHRHPSFSHLAVDMQHVNLNVKDFGLVLLTI
jgi:hypothetical protein